MINLKGDIDVGVRLEIVTGQAWRVCACGIEDDELLAKLKRAAQKLCAEDESLTFRLVEGERILEYCGQGGWMMAGKEKEFSVQS